MDTFFLQSLRMFGEREKSWTSGESIKCDVLVAQCPARAVVGYPAWLFVEINVVFVIHLYISYYGLGSLGF